MKKTAFSILLTLAALAGPSWSDDPPLSFQKLQGSAVNLQDLRKNSSSGAVLLVTWCAECPSCRSVERNIERLKADYDGQVDVVVVDVNAHDSVKVIRDFLGQQNLKLKVVLDEPGGLVERYHVLTTTTAFLFDASGKLRYTGAFQTKDEENARHAVAQLLNHETVDPAQTPEVGCTFAHRHRSP